MIAGGISRPHPMQVVVISIAGIPCGWLAAALAGARIAHNNALRVPRYVDHWFRSLGTCSAGVRQHVSKRL
jgi:hypothetical protein